MPAAENCWICNATLSPGSAWIVRCKSFVSAPRAPNSCAVQRRKHVCVRCSGLGMPPVHHQGALWRTASLAGKDTHWRSSLGVITKCVLEATPYIVDETWTVQVGSGTAKSVGIPKQLVSPSIQILKVWDIAVGAKIGWVSNTAGGGGSSSQALTTDSVFTANRGTSGLTSAGGKAHFHVNASGSSALGSTTRVWYNINTGTKKIRFSEVLNN